MMKDLLVANLKCFQSKSSKEDQYNRINEEDQKTYRFRYKYAIKEYNRINEEDQKTYQFRYKYAIKEYNRINEEEKRKHERQYCIAHKEEKRLREIGIAQLEDPSFTIPEWHI